MKLSHRFKHLVLELLPPTAFFFVSLQLILLTQSLMVDQYHVQVGTFIGCTVGAFVVAKVIALTDLLPFINRFPHKPLIYNIAWKTPIYFVATGAARYLEAVIHAFRKTHDLGLAQEHLIREFIWSRFWALQIWTFVLLILYCSAVELTRVLGKKRMAFLFFGFSDDSAPEEPRL